MRLIRVVRCDKRHIVIAYRPRLFGLVTGRTEISSEAYASRTQAMSVAYRIIEYRRHVTGRPSKFKAHCLKVIEQRSLNDLLARPALYSTHLRYRRWQDRIRSKLGVSRHLPVSELYRRK